jgi:pimeloyl-ACP methyl ester carboxylesterase
MRAAETHPAVTHLDLPDQRIAYRERPGTDPDALPLLLLHGGAVDSRMWGPQLGAFPDRRALAPDARGHGGSSDAEAPYRLVDDVIVLLDALGIAQVVAAGVSMGGGTAVDLALEHPERVAALVVSGTGTSEPEFTDPWALQAFADWRAAEQGSDAEAWIAVLQRFTAGPHRTRDEVDPAVWELIDTMARDTLAGHLRLGPDGLPLPPVPPTPVTGTWDRLGSIAVPVLAVSGALDGDDHRAMGERLAGSVGGPARHVEIPGAAHYPNLEAPEAFNEQVLRLLDAL